MRVDKQECIASKKDSFYECKQFRFSYTGNEQKTAQLNLAPKLQLLPFCLSLYLWFSSVKDRILMWLAESAMNPSPLAAPGCFCMRFTICREVARNE